MKFFISSIFLLLLAPCNSGQKLGQTMEDDFSKTIITYAETPCFGSCPVFHLILDGRTMLATYTGEANTSKIGTFTKSISNTEFTRFMEALNKAHFDKLDDAYLGQVSDFPTRELTVTINGKTKKVRDRSGAPPELNELEQVFKRFAETEEWNKAEIKDQ